ncbi:MAG: hypothetical protein E7291_07240 [Lachnospiraceae bacterium]|nr:hypothetical protein [Lachnospiraceae bacterium]
MSSNLLKRGYTNIQQDEKRIINTNELVAKRIQELAEKMQREENSGFVSGLDAPNLEVEALLADGDEEGDVQNRVIKANEDAKGILENARKEAETILEQARAQALQLEQDARNRAERERIQMLAQAKEQGVQQGKEMAAREAEIGREELRNARKQLEAEYQKLLSEMEPQLVDVITEIYEHVFHVELYSYREILSHLISTTMRKVEGNREFLVHVSKEDFPYISMQKKQIAAGAASANSSVEVIEDMTLSKNECLIETEGGIFDCGLGTQLSELRQKLKLLSYEKGQ